MHAQNELINSFAFFFFFSLRATNEKISYVNDRNEFLLRLQTRMPFFTGKQQLKRIFKSNILKKKHTYKLRERFNFHLLFETNRRCLVTNFLPLESRIQKFHE